MFCGHLEPSNQMDDEDLTRVRCPGGTTCKCALRGGWLYIHNGPWTPVLEVSKMEQKSKSLYIGHAPARLIDALSNVPAIETDGTSLELAVNYHKHIEYKNWQRQVDPSRMKKIGDFWYIANTSIANSVTLGARENLQTYNLEEVISIDVAMDDDGGIKPVAKPKVSRVRIKFDNWYKNRCNECDKSIQEILVELAQTNDYAGLDLELLNQLNNDSIYTDYCPKQGCSFHTSALKDSLASEPAYRPIEIIDGQHRVRGTQSGDSGDTEQGPPGACSQLSPTHINPDICNSSSQDCVWIEGIPNTRERLPFTLALAEIEGGGTRNFNQHQMAEIFQQITTKAEELDPFLKWYLLWRYNDKEPNHVQSIIEKSTFSMVDSDRLDFTSGTRQDAAMWILLMLASGEGIDPDDNTKGIWKGKISLINKSMSDSDECSSLEWMFSHIMNYYSTSDVFYNTQLGDPQEAAKLLARYGHAIRHTWGKPSRDINTATNARIFHWVPQRHGYNATTEGIPAPADGARGLMSHVASVKGRESIFLQSIMDIFPTVIEEAVLIQWIAGQQTTSITDEGILKTPGFYGHTASISSIKTVLNRLEHATFRMSDGLGFQPEHKRINITRVLQDAVRSDISEKTGVKFEIRTKIERYKSELDASLLRLKSLLESVNESSRNIFDFVLDEYGQMKEMYAKGDTQLKNLNIFSDPRRMEGFEELILLIARINYLKSKISSLGSRITEDLEERIESLTETANHYLDRKNEQKQWYESQIQQLQAGKKGDA